MSSFAGEPSRRERPLTGRQVLIVTLAFFGLVVAANLAFVFLALDTFSGTVGEHAYQDGLAYNERLAAAAEQRARGWQGQVLLGDGAVTLELADAEGRPVSGLTLTAALSRPATKAYDLTVALAEVAPGRYVAEVALGPGNWLAVVEGVDAEGQAFRTEARLWL